MLGLSSWYTDAFDFSEANKASGSLGPALGLRFLKLAVSLLLSTEVFSEAYNASGSLGPALGLRFLKLAVSLLLSTEVFVVLC